MQEDELADSYKKNEEVLDTAPLHQPCRRSAITSGRDQPSPMAGTPPIGNHARDTMESYTRRSPWSAIRATICHFLALVFFLDAAATVSLSAFSGDALIVTDAGLALNRIGSFVNGLIPSRAGFAGVAFE